MKYSKGQIPWNKGLKGAQTAWNKGITTPLEVRQKQSVARMGKIPWNKGLKGVQKAWNKNKICPQYRGENHWNWQGGITPEIRKIRNSLEYRLWRKSVFTRDGFTCVLCNKRGGKLEADHIKPFSRYPELRLNINNGRTLCHECHASTDTYLRKALYV